MDITVEIQGNDVAGYMIRGEREEKLCSAGQAWSVELDLNYPIAVKPWNSVVIYEEGTKVLTGFVASINYHIGDGQPGVTVTGIDTWKRALDGWSSEVYVVNSGDTAKSIMAKYLDEAGLSYSFNDVIDEPMPDGQYIPYMPYSEILYEVASAIAAYIRVDADGVVQIGHIMDEMADGPNIAVDDNMIAIDVTEDDAKARNKVIVWGPHDTGISRSDEDWATVDHTMVYASPYVQNAGMLSAAIHGSLHNLEIVKTVEMIGDPTLKVGQLCNITGPANTWSGEDFCTSVKSRWGRDGYLMTSKFGERCAIYGRGAPVPESDGRDIIVATWKHGVWRCRDIWAGTPHWESLNIGLDTAYPDYRIPANGGLMCDWFIRDPYEPNNRAFLQTKYAIYETMSLEPGEENWVPIVPYIDDSSPWGGKLTRSIGMYVSTLKVYKLRSTVARRGRYYMVIGPEGNEFGGWNKFVIITNDHFRTLHGGNRGVGVHRMSKVQADIYGPVWQDWIQGQPIRGRHEESTGLSSWHNLTRYCDAGKGGMAAWHRNDHGCTITGTQSALSSATLYNWPGPAAWHGAMSPWDLYVNSTLTLPHDEVILTDQAFVSHPDDPDDPETGKPPAKYRPYQALWSFCFNVAGNWYKHPSIHIPYDQTYDPLFMFMLGEFPGRKEPSVWWAVPGQWNGTIVTNTSSHPVRWDSYNRTAVKLPWTFCHFLQGSLGTYSPDRRKVYAYGPDKPSRFAYSEDEGDNWTEAASVPVKTSCFSGFPYSDSKVYAGRDPVRDETAPSPGHDVGDNALIYVSWDKGTTWTNVTGDLWDETVALGLRSEDGTPCGAYGLVTIAPRWI